MKLRMTGLFLLVAASFVLGQAQNPIYNIAVKTDTSTDGDLELIEGIASTLGDGAEVSQSLRKTSMAAVGELHLLLKERIDSSGNLVLDDGSITGLLDGGTIEVRSETRPGAQILFECKFNPAGQTCCVPTLLKVVCPDDSLSPGMTHVSMPIPPKNVKRHAVGCGVPKR